MLNITRLLTSHNREVVPDIAPLAPQRIEHRNSLILLLAFIFIHPQMCLVRFVVLHWARIKVTDGATIDIVPGFPVTVVRGVNEVVAVGDSVYLRRELGVRGVHFYVVGFLGPEEVVALVGGSVLAVVVARVGSEEKFAGRAVAGKERGVGGVAEDERWCQRRYREKGVRSLHVNVCKCVLVLFVSM